MVHPLSLVLLLMMPAQLAAYHWYWENSTSHITTSDITESESSTASTHTLTSGVRTEDSPKWVLVSSRPSGGIIEGTSVTLTCSSEANPSVENYAWFKRSGTEDIQIGNEQSYRIKNISIADSNKYKCRASNRHGSASSEYTAFDILYSPKKTSVSVTLTCRAVANPPEMEYTWFKEGESEPVAYGKTYSVANITEDDVAPLQGCYYCKAGNRIGHHFARPVSVTYTEESPKAQVAAAAIGGFCGGLFVAVLFTVLWIRRKKWTTNGSERGTTSGNYYVTGESRRKKQKKTSVKDDYENFSPENKDDTYTALNPMTKSTDDVYDAITV
ncbi:B-cell receptor CD22-like [Colossoma macropomum]|uniref:B-cell receptor CD22-like n=1 Tax=Colossoma macropomum TaxID=42526 RepID=UPI0018654E91|nr:B-cell receptor CD22-like [Colossoma macropomum]